MNPVRIHEHFHNLPEGTDVSSVRQRTCCLVGVSVGAIVPLPSAEIEQNDLRNYFIDNSTVLRDVAYTINEVVPFNVDRAFDYAYRIYERRYSIAFRCNPVELFSDTVFAAPLKNAIPEFDSLNLTSIQVADTIACLREGVKDKTGA